MKRRLLLLVALLVLVGCGGPVVSVQEGKLVPELQGPVGIETLRHDVAATPGEPERMSL